MEIEKLSDGKVMLLVTAEEACALWHLTGDCVTLDSGCDLAKKQPELKNQIWRVLNTSSAVAKNLF